MSVPVSAAAHLPSAVAAPAKVERRVVSTSPTAIDEPADRVERALARALTALPNAQHNTIGHSERASFAAHLVPLLRRDARWPGGIVSPPPALLQHAYTRLQRHDAASNDAPIRLAVLHLVAAAMRRGSALRAHRGHVDLLHQLSNDEVRLLTVLADIAPVAARLELQFDVLQDGLEWRRRVRMLDASETTPEAGDAPAWSGTGALERLGLVTWTDRTLRPADAPAFTRRRKDLGEGRLTVREGLRRWLAGRHMATVHANDEPAETLPNVGALRIEYRTLSLTAAGRDLARVICPARVR